MQAWHFRWSALKSRVFPRALRRVSGGAQAESSCGGGKRREGKKLTGIVGDRPRQTEPEELPKGDGLKDGVGAAMEVAELR